MDRLCRVPDFMSAQYWSPAPAPTANDTRPISERGGASALRMPRPPHISSSPSSIRPHETSKIPASDGQSHSSLSPAPSETGFRPTAPVSKSNASGAAEGGAVSNQPSSQRLSVLVPANCDTHSEIVSSGEKKVRGSPVPQVPSLDLQNIVGLSFDHVSSIISANPEAASIEVDGCYPLHRILAHPSQYPDCKEKIVKALLHVFPSATMVPDTFGNLPLHYAIRHCSSQIIVAVLAVHPEAASVRDDHNILPLHLLFRLRKNTDFAAIAVLVADPSALYKSSKQLDSQNSLGQHQSSSDFNIDSEVFTILMRCTRSDLGGDELASTVLKFAANPLYASLWLARTLQIFAVQQSSKDLVLVGEAKFRAAEMEQLSCSIVRKLPMVIGSSLKSSAGDDCLRYAATRDLKCFVSLPRCTRRIDALWSSTEAVGSGFHIRLSWRFWAHWASYFIFLVCLLYVPLLNTSDDVSPAPRNMKFECFLAFWLFTLVMDEIWNIVCIGKNIKAGRADSMSLMVFHVQNTRFTFQEGTKQGFAATAGRSIGLYLLNMSNWYNLLTLCTATAAAILREKDYLDHDQNSIDLCNQVFGWAVGLLWGRGISILLTNHFVGPLLLMVINMLFSDLSRFTLLSFLMPFTAALTVLEASDPNFATFQDSTYSFLKIIFGQGPVIADLQASSAAILALGSVVLVVLLLNLLIALFSTTFTTILQNSTENYLLHKSQLLFKFSDNSFLPPPLNLFEISHRIAKWFMQKSESNVRSPKSPFGMVAFCNLINIPKEPIVLIGDKAKNNSFRREKYDAEMRYFLEWRSIISDRFSVSSPDGVKHPFTYKYSDWMQLVLDDLEEKGDFDSDVKAEKDMSRLFSMLRENTKSISDLKASNAALLSKLDVILQHQSLDLSCKEE